MAQAVDPSDWGDAPDNEPNTWGDAPDTGPEAWGDTPALYEGGAVGFGFTSIARHVLEDWDRSVPMFQLTGEFPGLLFA